MNISKIVRLGKKFMGFKKLLLIYLVVISTLLLFSFTINDGNKEQKYYLEHIELLTKHGGKWKTTNQEYKPEDEFSPSHYGYEYSKGISDYNLKLRITAYYPKKMQWYVLTDGFYNWDFKNKRVSYFSNTPNGTHANGYSEAITENGMTLVFTITMPDGKQIDYRETETFSENDIIARNSEKKGKKWETKPASNWTRQNSFPLNYKIVYNAILDKTCGTYEVFTMNPDGSDKRNISNWRGADWAYATFGDKVYFVSDRDTTARLWFLYEMDVNGSNVRKVFNLRLEDSYVGINSNGDKIILKPMLKERNNFFIVDIKTGKVEDTLTIPLLNISDPIYLPGDKQIVFRGNKIKKEAEELYIINLNGTELMKITEYPKNDTTAKWYETHTGTPVWNSGAKCLTYFSKQANNHSIHSVTIEGGETKKITDNTFNEGWHVWTPDGKFLIYDGSDLQDKNFDIYLQDIEGGFIRRLTSDSIVEQAPLLIQYKKQQ